MAVKEYAYYTKGNVLKLVEREVNFDNDPNTKSYGPGVDRGRWKSPLSAITDGLQLQYTYVPYYRLDEIRHIGWNITGATDERNTAVYCPAYGEIEGYLTFFFPGTQLNTGVLDMSSLNTTDRYIIVHNHPKWNGVHKVQTASAQGFIKTYTEWSSGLTKLEEDDSAGEGFILSGATYPNVITIVGATSFNVGFSIGDYIFGCTDVTNAENEGLFRITDLSTSNNSAVYVERNYFSDLTNPGYLSSGVSDIQTETYTGGDGFMPQVLLSEGCYIDVNGVSVMQDESFDIDLPDYLAKAVEYYLKAMGVEDAGEIQLKEYYMKEFRKQIEKHATSRHWGIRTVASGPHGIR